MMSGDVRALLMFSWGKQTHGFHVSFDFSSVLQGKVSRFPLGAAVSLQQNALKPHKRRYFINRLFFIFCRKAAGKKNRQ